MRNSFSHLKTASWPTFWVTASGKAFALSSSPSARTSRSQFRSNNWGAWTVSSPASGIARSSSTTARQSIKCTRMTSSSSGNSSRTIKAAKTKMTSLTNSCRWTWLTKMAKFKFISPEFTLKPSPLFKKGSTTKTNSSSSNKWLKQKIDYHLL